MGSMVRGTLPLGEHFLKEPRDRTSDDRERPQGLKRKTSLRDSWKRKLLALPPEKRQKALAEQSRKIFAQKRTPLKKQSKGLKAETAKYRKLSAMFLAQPENKWCICCVLRREKLAENILQNQSTEIHHWAGRIKRLLCYVPYFKAFCYRCREWPHLNKTKARELGLLAPATLWEVYPEK